MQLQISPRDWAIPARDEDQLLEIFKALDTKERLHRFFRSLKRSPENRGFKTIDAGCTQNDRTDHEQQ